MGYWTKVFEEAVALLGKDWPAEAAFKQARNVVDAGEAQGSLKIYVASKDAPMRITGRQVDYVIVDEQNVVDAMGVQGCLKL